jgi:hypothetical protein
MTAALEGGEWSAARTGRTLPPGKTRYPFYRRLGGPQGRSGRAENLVSTGIRSRTVHPVVSRYTDWATGPTINIWYIILHKNWINFSCPSCTQRTDHSSLQWRTEGGFGVFKLPPPRNSEVPKKLCQTQPDLWKMLKIVEFRKSTTQDVRKKGSKILELPRFAVVLQ